MKTYLIFLVSVFTLFLMPGHQYSQCTGPGSEIHDDGTFENSYNVTADSIRFIIKMEPMLYPWQYNTVCVGWTRSSSGSDSLRYDIIVYDINESTGAPGPLLFNIPDQVVRDVPVMPEVKWKSTSLKIPYLLRKSYYIGVKFDNNPQTNVFIAADESPGTALWPGYIDTLGDFWRTWLPNQTFWSSYKCLAIRTTGYRASDNLSCVGGGGEEIHDDNTFENGSTAYYDTTRFVQKMQPREYPWKYTKACIGFTKTFPGTITSLDYDVIVFKDNGPNGLPGDLVAVFSNQHVAGIPSFPLMIWNSTDIDVPTISEGAYYVGYSFDNFPITNIFLPQDGSDSTPNWPRYHWKFEGNQFIWFPDSTEWPWEKASAIRTEGFLDTFTAVIKLGNEVPETFSLAQNYPNPFNPSTKIRFSIPVSGNGHEHSSVQLTVFDALGREIETLVNRQLDPGTYETKWDGDKFSAGVYFYRLKAYNYTETKKMVLIK